MDLGGTWRAIEADEGLRRSYPDPDFDDSRWADVTVPGHWRSSPVFAEADGPLLYRRRFDAPAPADGRRTWLTFDGLFYQGDLWLDGSYLGDTEGYFFPHTFEVTEALQDRREHVLALELTCDSQRQPDGNPGGIWRPVHLVESGPVRIVRLRVLCAEATPERAVVNLRAILDAADAETACITTTIGVTDHHLEQPLSAGENRVLWTVVVERPELWWPHALGDQPLHDVTVEVSLPRRGNEVTDRRELRTGLRQVRMKNWLCSVNGERLFLKGGNQEFGGDAVEDDVLAAKEHAGLDLLRVHGHVGRPELYEAADRHGVLLWQDLPLHGGFARGARKQAARQAREAVDLLGHHPSVAVWSDGSARRTLEKSDNSRPVVGEPRLSVARPDSGWVAAWPRLARFVAEIGADAVPETVEHLRRLKFRPAGGFCAPRDDEEGLAAACAPVIITADRPAAAYEPGDAVALDVHVVSDLRTPVENVRATATLRWDGGSASWSWEGDVAADSCVRVGMVRAVAPDAPGPLVLELSLDGDDLKAANRYESLVRRT